MIDIVLLVGRLLFVALLYLFLFAIMKTGIGLVKGQRKREKAWEVSVERGPKELRGVKMPVRGPVIVGRSAWRRHRDWRELRFRTPRAFFHMGQNLFVEDLGSTNGTAVNGQRIAEPSRSRAAMWSISATSPCE